MADYDNVNELQAPGQERYIVQYFRGINDHTRISEGYWQKMLNLSAAEYPVAMARQARKKAKYYTDAQKTTVQQAMSIGAPVDGTVIDDKLIMACEGGIITYGDRIMPVGANIKRIVQMGRLIYADNGMLFDPETDDVKNTRQYIRYDGNQYTVQMVDASGVAVTVQTVEPIWPYEGLYWMDANLTLRKFVQGSWTGKAYYAIYGTQPEHPETDMLWWDASTTTLKKYNGSTWQVQSTPSEGTVRWDPDEERIYTFETNPINWLPAEVKLNEPKPPEDGTYWYDSVRDGLYQWSDAQGMWISIATMYIKITLPAPTPGAESLDRIDMSGLKAGDAVEMVIERYKSSYIVHSVDDANHSIVLRGLLYPTPMPTVGVTIERKMPVMDYICEHNNRIWGCRYGENADGEFVNEIYASAPGDPMNWHLFEGTSADSWMTSVGAPGQWTGIKECGEYLCFFKEDCVFIVSGNTPASFRYMKYEGDGVQDGCDRSIQNIRGSLYYKSCHGIRKLTPYSYPQDVSAELGEDRWKDAIAGTDGTRYYVRMTEAGGTSLYIYDTTTGFWTREDAPHNMRLMVRYENELMAVCASEGTLFAYVTYDKTAAAAAKPKREDYPAGAEGYAEFVAAVGAWELRCVVSATWAGLTVLELITTWSAASFADLETKANAKIAAGYYLKKKHFWNVDYYLLHDAGRNLTPPKAYYCAATDDALTELTYSDWIEGNLPEWFGDTGTMGLSLPDEKRVRVIQMRVKLSAETRMRVCLSYDESGKWEEIWAINKGKTGTYRIAYTPARRNDTFRLRVEGSGPAVIYSITYQTEDGGDRNVC